MNGGADPESNLYRVLLDRLQSLEASHQKLKEQFCVLSEENPVSEKDISSQEKEIESDSGDMTSFPGWSTHPGSFLLRSPYRSVLEHIGHAVHVSRAESEEIVYWNPAAEKLFGYKEHEVIGQRAVELLFNEEHHRSAMGIMESLRTGESWSGQLPLKKRSGQVFMAMVTKNPLYEDVELVGFVTVSSDASVFNGTNTRNSTSYQDNGNEQPNVRRTNFKKVQWHPQPQIVAMPQLASSVSNLAAKVLSRKRSDSSCNACGTAREYVQAEGESQDPRADRPPRVPSGRPAFSLFFGNSRIEVTSSQKAESTFEIPQPSKIASKVFSKFQKGDTNGQTKFMDRNIQQNGSPDASVETTSPLCNIGAINQSGDSPIGSTHEGLSGAYQGWCELEVRESTYHYAETSSPSRERDVMANGKAMDVEDASPRPSDSHTYPSSGGSFGSGSGSSSSRGGSDSLKAMCCPIRWEDLKLLDEIGHGSFAAVYRGVWNGSDVAVKVYFGNQYSEQTLLDYKKEIDIMRRLRHPNVLLFMGAVCSDEKLAIVTEYMTRGSLFKTLHRNNQSLDIRRRLRMAIDVARGMNYLHHRNPPIVHRDLKSSNLLVDKSWTVKVGDFGLSKLKDATFLTAKSGRGTPQWMAPEVLRNEPSTEKSDIFSFGVILWELMTESIPWGNLNALQVVGVVGFMDRRLDLPTNMDPRVSAIISDCWISNPEDRPSFEDIIRKLTNLAQTANGSTTRTPSMP